MLPEKANEINANDLLAIVLHDIQSPLRFIGTITNELALNSNKIDEQTLQEHITIVNNSIVALQHYCSIIYNWKNNNLNSKNELQNINDIFNDIKKIYGEIITLKKIKFDIIKTDINYIINREALFIIIINLIDNAYKNTLTGIITLRAEKKDNSVSIIISDTGKGMSQETITEILNKTIQLKQSSLGFYIINNLLEKINATIEIDSEQNVGTKITINLSNLETHDSVYPSSSTHIN